MTFTTAVSFADIRIVEYAAPRYNVPLDVTAPPRVQATLADTGNVTTNYPTELFRGAGMTKGVSSPRAPVFTTRIITSPNGDIARIEPRRPPVLQRDGAPEPVRERGLSRSSTFRAAGQ